MIVSLRSFKKCMTNARAAVKAEPIEAFAFIQLSIEKDKLWVGGRSASVSYNKALAASEVPQPMTIYLPLMVVDVLPKQTKDDRLELFYSFDGDLVFHTSDEQGRVKCLENIRVSAPFADLEKVNFVLALQSGQWFANGVKFVSNVKKGWSKANRPYASSFVRLAAYEEEYFKEEEDAPDSQVCQFLLDEVTHDQERAMAYSSSLALSLFASDDQRFFQWFEPLVIASPQDVRQGVPFSTAFMPELVGQALHIDLSDAEILAKFLENEPYRIGWIVSSNRPDALVFVNASAVLWLRLSLSTYPDYEFNRQLSFFHGDVIAEFTPTSSFIQSVKSAEKLQSTREHGLTIRAGDGILNISSPEGATTVRYDTQEAVTYSETVSIVDATAFLAALDTKHSLILVRGEDFLAIYNAVERYRVVLKFFTR